MFSKKMQKCNLALVPLLILVLYVVDSMNLTHYVKPNLANAISGVPVGNQLQFDVIFEAEWWPHVTDYNKMIQLGILSAILIAGIITIAICDRQISRMIK